MHFQTEFPSCFFRNDDLCGDWYEPDDEYDSQFPRAAEETGWGIDESMYTVQLDKSRLTAEQIANAERIAAEIEVCHLNSASISFPLIISSFVEILST